LQDIAIIVLEKVKAKAGSFLEHTIMNIIVEEEKIMALPLTSWTNYFLRIINK
jgi:hypothetical protein